MIQFGTQTNNKFANTTVTLEELQMFNELFSGVINDSESITAISLPESEPSIAVLAGKKTNNTSYMAKVDISTGSIQNTVALTNFNNETIIGIIPAPKNNGYIIISDKGLYGGVSRDLANQTATDKLDFSSSSGVSIQDYHLFLFRNSGEVVKNQLFQCGFWVQDASDLKFYPCVVGTLLVMGSVQITNDTRVVLATQLMDTEGYTNIEPLDSASINQQLAGASHPFYYQEANGRLSSVSLNAFYLGYNNLPTNLQLASGVGLGRFVVNGIPNNLYYERYPDASERVWEFEGDGTKVILLGDDGFLYCVEQMKDNFVILNPSETEPAPSLEEVDIDNSQYLLWKTMTALDNGEVAQDLYVTSNKEIVIIGSNGNVLKYDSNGNLVRKTYIKHSNNQSCNRYISGGVKDDLSAVFYIEKSQYHILGEPKTLI